MPMYTSKFILFFLIHLLVLTKLSAQNESHPETQLDSEVAHHDHLDIANYLTLKAGAKIYAYSSQDTVYQSTNIINDQLGRDGFWQTKEHSKFPHWVIIELPKLTHLTTFAFNTSSLGKTESKEVTSRNLTVEFSSEGPETGYKKVLQETLMKNKDEQIFHVHSDSARWVRLTIYNNWKHPSLTELGRVYAYNDLAHNDFEMHLLYDHQLEVFDITFETNSAKIKKESTPFIETLIDIMEQNPDWKLMIEGHTDDEGSASHNLHLSRKRAANVMHLMIKYGISKNRLHHKGYGASQPLKKNESDEEKAKNRRVTFKLMNN